MTYEVGDAVTLTTAITTAGGAPTDATVALAVVRPDGTSLAPAVTRTGLGAYSATLLVDSPGTWRYAWKTSGAVTSVQTGHLVVHPADRVLPLATMDDVQALHPAPLTEQERALVEARLRAVSARVRSYCSQQVTRGTSTVSLSADDDVVALPQRPVVSVQSVSVDGAPLPSSSYRLRGNVLDLAPPLGTSRWRWYGRSLGVEVTYTHGHDPVPDDLVDLVASRARRALTNPDQVGSFTAGSLRVDFPSEQLGESWTPDEEATMRPYRSRRRVRSVRLTT